MKPLYFIRHAESEANRDRILAGRLPVPLTDDGMADARRIADEFRDIAVPAAIITSPLLRARQTAEAFSTVYGLDPEVEERLTEHHLGRFTGMTYDEVKGLDGYEADPLARWDWTPDGGGESYADIAVRVLSFLESLDDRSDDGPLLIVTHAVTLRLVTAALENTLPVYPREFPNNGEMRFVDYRGLGHRHDIRSLFLGESRRFNHNP